MKLVTFSRKNASAKLPGVLAGEEVVDLSGLGYPSVLAIIEAGDKAREEIAEDLEKAPRLPLSEVKLDAPLRPPRVFGIGLNYARHAAESKMTVQKVRQSS